MKVSAVQRGSWAVMVTRHDPAQSSTWKKKSSQLENTEAKNERIVTANALMRRAAAPLEVPDAVCV